MKQRLLVFLTALALLAGLLTVPAAAHGPDSTTHADKLVSLHLFQGTTNGYNLDSAPTRLQGLIMLVRLLGLEEEALACEDSNPFIDVTGTGDRYAAYAYAHGLTKGTGATTFTPSRALSAGNYVTFLLRALGYDDSQGDFAPSQSLAKAAEFSLMTKSAASALSGGSMDRGDLVDLSYAALTCKMKVGSQTLAEKLRNDGVFTEAEGIAANVLGENAGWTYEYTAPAKPAAPAAPAVPVAPAAGPSSMRKRPWRVSPLTC